MRAVIRRNADAERKHTAADHARLIVALIRTLGLRRVHLVGFDFGGPTAVMVCAQAPELVATLALAATNVLTDTGIPLPLQLVRPPVVGDVFSRLLFGRTGLTMMWFAAVARGVLPRVDVGVMVELRDDDLVARRPAAHEPR